MLVLCSEIHDLGHFGFGHFICEYAAHADAFLVDMQHHAGRLIGIHREESLQHMDYKLHRRVVIVEQQYLILAGLLCFGAGARRKADAGTSGSTVFVVVIVDHENLHVGKIG